MIDRSEQYVEADTPWPIPLRWPVGRECVRKWPCIFMCKDGVAGVRGKGLRKVFEQSLSVVVRQLSPVSILYASGNCPQQFQACRWMLLLH
ncbi:hypothetical protein CA13_69570 [Planctomycetes bacterium CA13]|uniref:Uncharacterized protein n=1 Tax=Novipirellula herctigrandis TaxID=2527986 RepID=A0A5C5YNK0_9BACT|nr:hypothetical protein CA13_69570 [Planctomycetes bacterium CA13]